MKLFKILYNKIKELQKTSGFKYLGLRVDKKLYKVGEVLSFNSKSIESNQILPGICTINISKFITNEELKFNIHRDLAYTAILRLKNYNLYILGSNKINDSKKYNNIRKDLNEIRLIKPTVLFQFNRDFHEDDFSYNKNKFKNYFLNSLLQIVIWLTWLKILNENQLRFCFTLLNKERKNKNSNKNSLKKLYLSIFNMIDLEKLNKKKYKIKDDWRYLLIMDFDYLYNDSLQQAIDNKYSVDDYFRGLESGKYKTLFLDWNI